MYLNFTFISPYLKRSTTTEEINHKLVGKKISLLAIFIFLIKFFSLSSLHAETISLGIGGAELLQFKTGISEIFIANPEVADVQVSDKHVGYVFGKAAGRTKLFAMNAKGQRVLTADVIVTPNLSELKELIATYDPHELVEIKYVPSGILLEGQVDTPKIAENIVELTNKFIGEKSDLSVINQMTIKAPVQVNLRVKFAEVDRSVLNQLGFNWQTIVNNTGGFELGSLINRAPFSSVPLPLGSVTTITQPQPTQVFGSNQNISTLGFNYTNEHVNLNTAIDLLSQEGLVTVLAEPNLVAVSGETASFLAGGEFPYPIPQQFGNITIEFKQYGVSLAFTPTVLDGKLISMRVRPEVSELDPNSGLILLETAIPGILTRRAETTVQLGSGQTFAIAGLLRNKITSNISSLPGLGDLPILGPLFRSNSFQRGDSELVILVTPFLVEPVSGQEMLSPLDGLNYATFVEQVLERRLTNSTLKKGESPAFGPGGIRLIGPAGFSLE